MFKEITKKGLIYLIIIYFLISNLLEFSTCLFRNTTGIPCPSCGLTRSALSLIKLNIKDAVLYHGLIFLVIIIFLVILFKKHTFVNKIYANKWFWIISITILISYYLIRMLLYFPNIPPMDFNHDAIIPRLIKLIGK